MDLLRHKRDFQMIPGLALFQELRKIIESYANPYKVYML